MPHVVKDVGKALCDIIRSHGCMEAVEAAVYIDPLAAEKCYLRDVY